MTLRLMPPEVCPNLKCKATEVQCDDYGLVNTIEYRETWSCLVCGKSWHNVYRYAKTKNAKPVPVYDEV